METNWSQKHRTLSQGKIDDYSWEVATLDQAGGDHFTTTWLNKQAGPNPRHLVALGPRPATTSNLAELKKQLQTARKKAQLASQQDSHSTYLVVLSGKGFAYGQKRYLLGCDSIWQHGIKQITKQKEQSS